jgi:hypothetical protein
MPSGGTELLEALAAGYSLSEAARLAAEAHECFDLKANLAGLIAAQVFVGCSLTRPVHDAEAKALQ